MSKVKSPQEKKTLSLKHDRRNTYGENAKSSRKNIPKSKQQTHQRERRAVRGELAAVRVDPSEEAATNAQRKAATKARLQKLKGFKKTPDTPLGEVLRGRQKR